MPKSKLSRNAGQKAPIKASRSDAKRRVKNPHLGTIPKSTNLTFGYSYSSPSHSSSSSHAAITPKASDIDQGLLGNCYFLATLASIANANPKLITNLIKPAGKDDVLVTLFTKDGWTTLQLSDDVPKRYEVLRGRKDAFSRGAHWVKMFEKALAHLYGSYANTQGSSTQGQTSTTTAMQYLGFQANNLQFDVSKDQALAVLAYIKQHHSAVAARFEGNYEFILGLTKNLTYEQLDGHLKKLNLDSEERRALLQGLVDAGIVAGPSGSGQYTAGQLALFNQIRDHIGFAGQDPSDVEGDGAYDMIAVAGMTQGASNPFNLPEQHAYSVLGVEEKLINGNVVKYIKLRNPWGHYDKSKWKGYEALVTDFENGEFLVPLDAAGGLSFTFGELRPAPSESSSSSTSTN